ncbi:hypothetical protein T492DRAFT_880031 [Pavlovales sp. CCMP2436]|nr:hypothetical protein T492DRAFT_880031 [Pavlovales sp. CCMP2436]
MVDANAVRDNRSGTAAAHATRDGLAGFSVFMVVHFEKLAQSHLNRFVRDVARSFVFLLNKTGSVEDMEPGAVLQQFPLVMTGLRGPFAWAPEWHAMRAVIRAFLLDFSFERGGAAERMLHGREWSLDSLGQHMPMPARAFEARSAVLNELGRWAGPRQQAPSLAASTGGGAMAAGYSEEVGDAIFASARCYCLVAALRVLCASVDWSRDLTHGPDGGSLLALVRSERGAAARRMAYEAGNLPPWFYFVFCAARCVPLRKCAAQVGVAEAARPIGISCALRRGLTKGVFLNKGLRGEIEEYLFPQQLGVLVSAGGTKFIFGVRELLENPHFCIAGSDIYNAFNEGDRAEMVARTLVSSPGLAPLARLFYATLASKYPIFVTGKGGSLMPMGRDGETGVAQGSLEAGVAFAISIHPELKVLDAELRPYGGGARAGHDDVRPRGPPWIVFAAMQRFLDALFLRLGLVVQPSKCECWIEEVQIASLDAHRGLVTRSHLLEGALTPHYGVMCYGLPIGSEEYVKLAFAGKCDEIASISNKLIATLSSSHKQQLWLLTLFSTVRKFEYFARHYYPEQAHNACTRVDAIIHAQATHALGVSLDDDQLATSLQH